MKRGRASQGTSGTQALLEVLELVLELLELHALTLPLRRSSVFLSQSRGRTDSSLMNIHAAPFHHFGHYFPF